MSTNSFGYDIKSVALNYTKYRPLWPTTLYDKIYSYLDNGSPPDNERRGMAVDAGCGSGQSTLELCKQFNSVIGIDPSEAQLEEAREFCAGIDNVVFKLGSAEMMSSAFEDRTVDLIVAGCALHWFDLDVSYAESLRVLKSGGTLAAFSWQLPSWGNEQAHEIIHQQTFRGIFEPYWQKGAYHVFDYYREPFSSLKLYFEDAVRDDSLIIEYHLSLNEVLGLFKSFPQYYYYKADHPEHPDEVDDAIEKLKKIYGATSMEEKVAKCSRLISLIMGRKGSDVREM